MILILNFRHIILNEQKKSINNHIKKYKNGKNFFKDR